MNLLQQLLKLKNRLSGRSSGMSMEPGMAKDIVKGILSTREDEISCDECFVQIDQFAEMNLENLSPEEALPLVEAHLKRCGDCREEFEMLLDALAATA